MIVAVLYWPTTVSLHRLWQDFDKLTYTHGYLILGVSGWLLWRARGSLRGLPLQLDRRALVLLTVLSLTWLLALRSGIEVVGQTLLPLIAWTAVWAACGWAVARKTALAFGYVYFAVPVWSLGNGLLQLLTVHAVSGALAVTGFTAYVDGNFVHIPSGIFEVAGGCSGLHFFVVALALATLYGELNRDSWRARTYLLALAAGLALLSNWIRVYSIIVAGYLTNMQHSLIREGHYDFGWKLFAGMLVLFFVIARYLPVSPTVERPSNEPAGPGASRRAATALIGVVLVAALGPAWGWWRATAAVSNDPKVALPAQVASWNMVPPGAFWQPRFKDADELQHVAYRGPLPASADIEVLLVVYHMQRQGKELVSENNSLLGKGESLGQQPIDLGDHRLNELHVRDAQGEQALIWYGYRVGAVSTVSALRQQLLYGVQSLVGAPTSRILALRAPCADNCDAARSQLRQLVTALSSANIG
jgi:exosortase A